MELRRQWRGVEAIAATEETLRQLVLGSNSEQTRVLVGMCENHDKPKTHQRQSTATRITSQHFSFSPGLASPAWFQCARSSGRVFQCKKHNDIKWQNNTSHKNYCKRLTETSHKMKDPKALGSRFWEKQENSQTDGPQWMHQREVLVGTSRSAWPVAGPLLKPHTYPWPGVCVNSIFPSQPGRLVRPGINALGAADGKSP